MKATNEMIAAAQSAHRRMLTDDEILDLVRECDLDWHAGFSIGDEDNRYARLARAIEAALAAAPQPQGDWVMVPREATREMVARAVRDCGDIGGGSCGERSAVDGGDMRAVWDTMIAAAPPCPPESAQPSAEPPRDIEALIAAAPQGEPVAFHELLREAEAEVRAKPVWRRYIDGTPLANDVPVWMAVFAQHHARAPAPHPSSADLERLRAADEEHRRAQAAIYDALQPESPDRDTWPDEIRRLRAAQPSTEPTTECTTCGATVVRVTGVYDYPPPGDELVRAARAALAAWPDLYAAMDDAIPSRWLKRAMDDAIDALRRALDAPEAKGGGR